MSDESHHQLATDCTVHKVTQFLILNVRTAHPVGTAVVQWLRCCATIRKVAGSIPAVSGYFIDIKSF